MSDHPERLEHEPALEPSHHHGSVLTVGLPDSDLTGSELAHSALADPTHLCTATDTGRGAIELMRMLRFDLVITADRLPDMPVWQFVQRMRRTWPWQKWALFSTCLSESDEITARTLGVMRIIEGSLDWDAVSHLAETLHDQAESANRLPQLISVRSLPTAARAG